jgi:hypothetical protein
MRCQSHPPCADTELVGVGHRDDLCVLGVGLASTPGRADGTGLVRAGSRSRPDTLGDLTPLVQGGPEVVVQTAGARFQTFTERLEHRLGQDSSER